MGVLFPDDPLGGQREPSADAQPPAPPPADDQPPAIANDEPPLPPPWVPGDPRHLVVVLDPGKELPFPWGVGKLPPIDSQGDGHGLFDISAEEGLSRLAALQPNRITYLPGQRMAYVFQRHPVILRRVRVAYVFDLDGSTFMNFMANRFGPYMKFCPPEGDSLAIAYERVRPVLPPSF